MCQCFRRQRAKLIRTLEGGLSLGFGHRVTAFGVQNLQMLERGLRSTTHISCPRGADPKQDIAEKETRVFT